MVLQVDFRFHNVRFSVEVSRAKATVMGGKAGVKEILRGVSGAVESGQILAIIGSSGSGKTSLLDVLVGKVCLGNVVWRFPHVSIRVGGGRRGYEGNVVKNAPKCARRQMSHKFQVL